MKTKKEQAVEQVEAAFRNFDKWTTYGLVFSTDGLMDRRLITLRQIKEIAYCTAWIGPEVIEMRRLQFLGM